MVRANTIPKWQYERLENENPQNEGNIKIIEDQRDPFELDKTRVVHTFAFRRLQGKFQMISGTECDFNRNRLTHSLEVASLAKNIYLKVMDDIVEDNAAYEDLVNSYLFKEENILEISTLLETISFLHDIGNPPFGHAGEVALNRMMIDHGGFEGNAQALHMLTRGLDFFPLERFNLTKRTLLGILKYPASYGDLIKKRLTKKENSHRKMNHESWKPPKCYYDSEKEIVRRLLLGGPEEMFTFYYSSTESKDGESKYKTFDCSIMDIADDISNSVHDLEDVIYLEKISQKDFNEKINQKLSGHFDIFNNILSSRTNSEFEKLIDNLFIKENNKKSISDMVYLCVRGVKIIRTGIDVGDDIFLYNVQLDGSIKELVNFLKKYIADNVIESDQIQTIVHGGMVVISRLFDAYESNPKQLLSTLWYKLYESKESDLQKRIICNFIAGMTDEYAYRMYSRLYGHNTRNMFEKI